MQIKDLNEQHTQEMTMKMDVIANNCIAQLEEIAKLYGLKIKVDILLSDVTS